MEVEDPERGVRWSVEEEVAEEARKRKRNDKSGGKVRNEDASGGG